MTSLPFPYQVKHKVNKKLGRTGLKKQSKWSLSWGNRRGQLKPAALEQQPTKIYMDQKNEQIAKLKCIVNCLFILTKLPTILVIQYTLTFVDKVSLNQYNQQTCVSNTIFFQIHLSLPSHESAMTIIYLCQGE